ncbi:MAG: VWA domain-containing protein [Granulosicoccus sp.]
MLLDFHDRLRRAGIAVSMGEWLTLMQGLSNGLGTLTLDRFYFLARLTLIKNEALYDRFDQVFDAYWSGHEQAFEQFVNALDSAFPEDWLRRHGDATISDEQKRKIESLGGWDKLMQTLLERLEEQNEEHHGGNRWIGTGGTSPFGNSGFNPQGIRIGQSGRDQGKAVKVWQKRNYRDLDGKVELGTRNFKMALRKLRRLAREGKPDRLDLDNTIKATAGNAGLLDIRFRAERQNAVKVLLLIDIGGSMDYHAQQSEQLFSAARSEFKRLDTYWFHNCVYETLWKENQRGASMQTSTLELIRTLNRDHRLIIIGDATMSPYEITIPGGSVEHWNEEAGAIWLRRLQMAFPHCVWINPQPSQWWNDTPSVRIIRELMHDRMYPMNVDGLQAAIDALKTPVAGVTTEGVPLPDGPST